PKHPDRTATMRSWTRGSATSSDSEVKVSVTSGFTDATAPATLRANRTGGPFVDRTLTNIDARTTGGTYVEGQGIAESAVAPASKPGSISVIRVAVSSSRRPSAPCGWAEGSPQPQRRAETSVRR